MCDGAFRSVWLSACLLALLSCFVEPAAGQGPSRVRLGVGGAMGGDYLASWGGHGSVEVSANPGSAVELRGGMSLAMGTFWGQDRTTALGMDVASNA